MRDYTGFSPRSRSFRKMSLSAILSLFLSLLLLLTVFQAQFTPNVYGPPTVRYVPGTYPTIQAAIDASRKGDIIQVAPGTYYENVIVNMDQLKIIGENKTTTIIDSDGMGPPVSLEANTITITGFTIGHDENHNSNYGITAILFGGHNISDNIIRNNVDGIFFSESSSNIVSHNIFLNNSMHAINMGDSLNNQITDNTISESAYGIYLLSSNGTTVLRNSVSNTSYGIYSSYTTQNTIANNTVQFSSCGIITSRSDNLYINNNTISGGMYAMQVQYTSDSQLANNTLTQASYGLYLAYSNSNTFGGTRGNLVARNDWGLIMYNSTGNQIIDGNTIAENTWGIYLVAHSSGNTIYHNNFISNVRQAYQDIGNINTWWNTANEGNYWDDYNGYPPAAGVDYYPLSDPWPMRNLAITNVVVSQTLIYPGDPVTVNVTVENLGAIIEIVKVTAYYDSTAIGTNTATLAAGAVQTLTINWNTFDIEGVSHTISATVEPIPYIERNYADNTLTDGTVQVGLLGDINRDHAVDNQDLTLLKQAFCAVPGDGNWNPNADLNHDAIIDAKDLQLLGENYGATG